jgi:hypothetical protein
MSLMEFLRVRRTFAAADALWRAPSLPLLLTASLHAVAIGVMALSEVDLVGKLAFALTWGVLNFFWLIVLRRPVTAAALSLVMLATLIRMSQLKFEVLWQTASFVDLMVVDIDTIAFLFTVFPAFKVTALVALAALVPVMIVLWRADPFRIRRHIALYGLALSTVGVAALAIAVPMDDYDVFRGQNHVSVFARSGVQAVSTYLRNGLIDAAPSTGERLPAPAACEPARKLPHIIMVHDESNFDIRAVPGVKVQPGYGGHFRSFDGVERKFVGEGAGGPSWYAEFNVLSGLSARSYGGFAYFVTRIAARQVDRGLPNALVRCGYRTFSFYPFYGVFMDARKYQARMGIQHFYDSRSLGARGIEPDRFFYNAATRKIAQERADGPMFLFVYLGANHFPWDTRYRPDLTPDWRAPGNSPIVDEYLRRQQISFDDYAAFVGRLKRDFPDERFLIVRYGDHQPEFATDMIDPSLNAEGVAQRLIAHDPRFYTSYYAIDGVNFTPPSVASALPTLEGPYLPLVIQEAAGVPLDPSFVEQKAILQRCGGTFYACAGGAEARRFNRLLIDSGLIRGP